MTQTIITLTVGYALVAVLVALVVLQARFHWLIKGGLTLALACPTGGGGHITRSGYVDRRTPRVPADSYRPRTRRSPIGPRVRRSSPCTT